MTTEVVVAGSGKSTLLAGWLTEQRASVAWLQVEASDADPARFWSYVMAAVGRVQPEVEASVRPVVATAGGDADAVVTALVNTLSELGEPLIVVIDDYHVIDDERVHEGLERLIALWPPQVTIVVATRVDPPLRLGRLRVRDQMSEIRAGDLCFHRDEAAPLLGSAALGAANEALAGLIERTEGWAAGLVLAGLSIEPGGLHRRVRRQGPPDHRLPDR